eukprot:4573175-Alexandrium_andersonii.AAC.1
MCIRDSHRPQPEPPTTEAAPWQCCPYRSSTQALPMEQAGSYQTRWEVKGQIGIGGQPTEREST